MCKSPLKYTACLNVDSESEIKMDMRGMTTSNFVTCVAKNRPVSCGLIYRRKCSGEETSRCGRGERATLRARHTVNTCSIIWDSDVLGAM